MSKDEKPSAQKYQKYWDIVEKALNEGTISGYKIAIIETEKILSIALDEKEFPGEDIQQRIKSAEKVFKNPEKLHYARAMYNRIIREPGFDVSYDDTKEIISAYYRAISDIIEKEPENIDFIEKMRLNLQNQFNQFLTQAKKILFLLFLFFAGVFILIETSLGHSISKIVADFTRFLFYKVIPAVVAATIAALVIIGLFYWWQSRKK